MKETRCQYKQLKHMKLKKTNKFKYLYKTKGMLIIFLKYLYKTKSMLTIFLKYLKKYFIIYKYIMLVNALFYNFKFY